ncbi:hypothetical protein ACVGWD_02870, partial [Enterobacter asburiae]
CGLVPSARTPAPYPQLRLGKIKTFDGRADRVVLLLNKQHVNPQHPRGAVKNAQHPHAGHGVAHVGYKKLNIPKK